MSRSPVTGRIEPTVTACHEWRSPSFVPGLDPGEVHVWKAKVAGDREIRSAERLLSAAEIARARSFVSATSRAQFVTGRLILRRLLANYNDCLPREVELRISAHGKPAIYPQVRRLEFNLSHSYERLLFAFAVHGPVGVDVERVDNRVIQDALVRSAFCEREQSYLASVPPDERQRTFFQGWTRKEALLKALGTGFSRSPHEVSVFPPHPIDLGGEPRTAGLYEVLDLPLEPRFAGTAAALAGSRYRLFDFDASARTSLGPID